MSSPVGYPQGNSLKMFTDGTYGAGSIPVGVTDKKLVPLYATTSGGRIDVFAGLQQVLIPRTLALTGVHVAVVGSATWNNTTGSFTLGTAFPRTYSLGIWIYFSGSGIAGSTGGPAASGLYWCVMSSATDGQAYALSGDPSVSWVPYTPTTVPTLLTTTAGTHSPVLSTNITVLNVTVPGGTLGRSGAIHGRDAILCSSSANSKNSLVQFGSTTLMANNAGGFITTSGFARRDFSLYNAGDEKFNFVNSYVYIGVTPAAPIYTAIDTTADQSLKVTLQLTHQADYMILAHFFAEVLAS